MLLIDANAILRYMMNDNHDMAVKVCDLIAKSKVFVRYEVLAEVIYVLSKVYLLPRNEIADGICIFLAHPNLGTESDEIILLALKTYKNVHIDFVDCVLYAFKGVYGYDVFTFDKKLNSMMNKLN